jgi:hypothetical protein
MNFSKLNLRTPAQAKANLANLLGIKLELSLCSFMTTKGLRRVTVNGCYGSVSALRDSLRLFRFGNLICSAGRPGSASSGLSQLPLNFQLGNLLCCLGQPDLATSER